MPFRDKYTNFTFDGIAGSSMKVWVTNAHDIQFALTPNFSSKFTSPIFGDVRYYEGTTVDKTDIAVNCIAIDIDMNEWRAISNWLSATRLGKLSFDFNNRSYYNVKIDGKISGEVWVLGRKNSVQGDRYNVTFKVKFTTVGDYAALSPDNISERLLRQENKNGNNVDTYHFISDYNNSFCFPSVIDTEDSEVTGYCRPQGHYWDLSDCFTEGNNQVNVAVANSVTMKYIKTDNLVEVQRNNEVYGTFDIHRFTFRGDDMKLPAGARISGSCLISNLGTEKLYPYFTLSDESVNTIISCDGKEWYNYKFSFSEKGLRYNFNSRTGLATLNGRLLENIVINNFALINKVVKNEGPLALETSCPEMHRIGGCVSDTNNKFITFTLDEMPIYYHNENSLLIYLFDKIPNANPHFGGGEYGAGSYGGTISKPDNTLIIFPWKVEYSGNTVTVWYNETSNLTSIANLANTLKGYKYIVLTKYHTIEVPSVRYCSIDLQYRNVI